MAKRGEGFIYSAITLVSILLCLFLGGIMFADRGKENTSEIGTKRLDEVEQMEGNVKETVVSQEEIAEKLGSMLPDTFPKTSVKMEIKGNGSIYTGMRVTKTDIENMVRDGLGVKEKLMLKMLPENFEMGIFYRVGFDEETAMLSFSADSLNINGMKLDVNMAPPEIPHEIAQAVNKVLLDSGCNFTKIQITDGAVILKP